MENKDLDIEIYNDEQKWWVTIQDNSIGAIEQMENGIKLQKEINALATSKILELKEQLIGIPNNPKVFKVLTSK